jgi:hypothetical protein
MRTIRVLVQGVLIFIFVTAAAWVSIVVWPTVQ